MQYESENPLLESHWNCSQKTSAKSVTNAVKDFTKHCDHGKAVPRQVDLKYVGRILLDTEEGYKR